MNTIEQVTLLYEISNALNEHLDLKKAVYKVLDLLSNSMQMERGTVSILNPLRNEISIEVAHSLSKSAMDRVKYKLGEGIIGRVIETGKAVAIPQDQRGTPLSKPDRIPSTQGDGRDFVHLCSRSKGKAGRRRPER